MLEKTDTLFLLEWARDIGNMYSFLDFHVHPFDVLTADITYHKNEQIDGLFSRGSSKYQAPVVSAERIEPTTRFIDFSQSTERALILASRLRYIHTGQKVIEDQINAVSIVGALLLPVARVPGEAEKILEALKMMFKNNERMCIGCPFPVGLPVNKLAEFFYAARDNYGIRAIKLHPNLVGIDPLNCNGHDLIEATLESAGELSLPIVVHAGRTPALEPPEAVEFGMLSRLETINWSLTSSPVILAHAGCYNLTEDEVNTTLFKLDALLQKHPNLIADISNLEPFAIHQVLKKVDPNRLVFGSDALYVPVWKAWLRFLRTLRDVSLSPDTDLARIASINPKACLRFPTTESSYESGYFI